MSTEIEFRALLADDPALSALVGNRIALNATPELSQFPVVVFTSMHDRWGTLGDANAEDQVTLLVQCWDETAAGADAVADAVEAAISTAPAGRCAAVTNRASTFDADMGLDGVSLTVEWWA